MMTIGDAKKEAFKFFFFIFNLRMSLLSESVHCACRTKTLLRLNTHWQRSIQKENTKNWPLPVHVLPSGQRTGNKYTKIQNVRSELLCYSLILFLVTLLLPSLSWFVKALLSLSFSFISSFPVL